MSRQQRPGWYPDPEQPGQERYWDGTQWTDYHQLPPPQQRRDAIASDIVNTARKYKLLTALGGGLLLILIVRAISGGDGEGTSVSPSLYTSPSATTVAGPTTPGPTVSWGKPTATARPAPPPTTTVDEDELKEATYIALLIERGMHTEDYPYDQLILHGTTVCVFLSQPGFNIFDALAGLMTDLDYTPEEAGAIARGAIDVWCPEELEEVPESMR